MNEHRLFKATNALVIIAVVIQIILWLLGKPVPLLPDLGSPPINIYLPVPMDPCTPPTARALEPPRPDWVRIPPHRLRRALVEPATRHAVTPNAIASTRCFCPPAD